MSYSSRRPALQWNTRVDQNLRDYKDRVYFSFFRTTTEGQQGSTRQFLRFVVPSAGAFARPSWTHTFTPGLINEASMSMVRAGGNTPPAPGGEDLPNASISGISTAFSQGGYYRWQHHNFIWHDGLTWMRGKHQIRFGLDLDRQRGFEVQSNNARPNFQFSNILDFAQDSPFSQSGPTIDIAKGDTALDLYRKLYVLYAGLYVQDDWKLTQRVTLNAGLRWDYFGHWATGHQGIVPFPIFTPGSGSSFQEQVAVGATKVRGAGQFTDNRPNGFAPRIGVAWDVFGNGSTSVRASYGLFYSRVANLAYATNGSNTNPPAFGSPSLTVQQPGVRFGYALGQSNGYYFAPPPGFQLRIDPRGGIVGTRVSVGGMEPSPVQPRTHDWTFSIQRRLGGNYVVEADYLGTHSAHLFTQTDVNRYAGDLVQHNGALSRLNPSFGPIVYGRMIGNSDAHIFSFALGRRFSHGWSVKTIYTTGRALDIDSSNDNGVGGGRNILDAHQIDVQRGRADYDIRRRITVDSVWEAPTPFKHGVLHVVTGGWRLSTIAMFSSGRPFTVFSSSPYPNGDFNADGFNWDVPNTPAFGNSISASRSNFISGLFKAADFPRPNRGVRGDLGRNTFEGPGLANINLNVIKATKIPWFAGGREGATLEFRGEIFNLLNRVNLTAPSSDLASGLFGRSTDQSLPRAVQLAIRIQF
ncbi:MAG: TonB-dependent receptor [Bryobacterales bacterium]|nr:TonB-dependent receptor [Bryobacterales bacterium]